MHPYESLFPILQVGYGYMGQTYVDLLQELGVPAHMMIVTDQNPDALNRCHERDSRFMIASTLEEALKLKPKMCLNLTNSPSHLGVFEQVIDAGVEHIYSEKPVVLASQLEELKVLAKRAKTFSVGYLINFSDAVGKLMSYMSEYDLGVMQGSSRWGKDRSADLRATGGDLEDELTHAAELLFMLVRHQDPIKSMKISAMLDTVPFVNLAAQIKAHQQDESYPLTPISSANVGVALRTDSGSTVRLLLQSSFVSFDQVRVIELVLSNGLHPLYKAQLCFDVEGADQLRFCAMGTNVSEVISFPSKNKLRYQLMASLDLAAGLKSDPRLTHIAGAIANVQFSQDVLDAATA